MSSNKRVPHVVNITVYGAKGLKPKKDKHKFCVIFGIGKSKFRTDVVEDLFDNPVFNKEAEIAVEHLEHELKFKVTEKNEKDVLGEVVVPLYELGEQSMSSPHKVPLRPHRKCPTPHGMLIFEAWVVEKKMEKLPPRSSSLDNLRSIKSIGISSGFKKLKERIGVSGKSSEEKIKKSSTESLFSLKSRSAVSCQDMTRDSHFCIPADRHSLHSVSSETTDFDTRSELTPQRNSFRLDKVSEFSCPSPEVTSVSPKSGPETGGTVLTIRGSNLGQNHEDIVTLNICGSDLLETLEYISPWKLQCKTLPWNPCAGNISIETLSGGRGTSLIEFSFSEVERPKSRAESNSDVYFPQKSQSKVSEGSKPESNTQDLDTRFDSNDDEYGLAVPYSDSETQNSFQVDGLNAEQIPPSTVPPDKRSRIFSGEDGAIRLIVRGDESRLNDDVETANICNISPTSKDVAGKGCNNRSGEDEPDSMVVINRSKATLQNSVPSTEISTGQNKSDGKANGAPVKLPPPVVEIQPMRMEGKNIDSTYGKGSDGIPPEKPPRQFPGRSNSVQSSFDQPSLFQESIDRDDHEKMADKEIDQIKDLEMQLFKKTNEIEMLVQLKKSLTDENWRLKQYVEALVMRAIKICPEVLCIDNSDDSFA